MINKNKIRVLMVCLGNICRSPTAQGVMEKIIKNKGLSQFYELDSAGTAAYHVGNPPDERAIGLAKLRDIDLSELRARQVALTDFTDFDYILAMDNSNLRDLKALKPLNSHAQVLLYLSPGGVDGIHQVPDPYYGGDEGFNHVLDLLVEGGEKFIAHSAEIDGLRE